MSANIYDGTTQPAQSIILPLGDTSGRQKAFSIGTQVMEIEEQFVSLHDGVTEGGFGKIPFYAMDAPGELSIAVNSTTKDLEFTLPDETVQIVRVPTKTAAYVNLTTLTITHNFGFYPVVFFITSAGVVTAPTSITHDSLNAFTIATAAPATGVVVYR